ncbi:WXG100 protein secretion system (Wss), protein YukD [Nocardioides terrae]|uniref:WXG100 protein secretion system (Wss), protein YukD n=1 Tax=Nocardioides terrae TaxID=574651 RepID=A0A1I1GZB0_9ACTN|nr:EsaB/YukD family protein [Nocardioides terrae]SFC15198.1 WXG100 protein secretion system (Wss), protein YukD [Nocardioides terrae]
MTTALLRVSVVGGGRRLDLAVPSALPVAELVPGLARRLDVESYDGLRLCTVSGAVLDDRAGLSTQDVPDGAVLVLAPPPPPPTVHDDPVEALPSGVPVVEPAGWPVLVGAVLLVLAAVPLAVVGDGRLTAALALVLLADGLGRRAAPAAIAATLIAAAYAALAAVQLAADLRPGDVGVACAAGGGAILAVASLAMTGLPAHRLRLLPAAVIGAVGAVIGAVLSIRDVPLSVLASVLIGLGTLVTGGLPWVAVGRITRPRGRVDVDALADEARTARELLLGASVGLAVVHVGLTPLVARHGPAGLALSGCAAAIVLLRARHLAPSLAALPGLAAGALGLLVTVGVALWEHDTWRTVGALGLAGAGGVLLAVARGPTAGGEDAHGPALLVRPLLRALETACLVALLPLLVLAGGALESLP